jgi:hypothetical protein
MNATRCVLLPGPPLPVPFIKIDRKRKRGVGLTQTIVARFEWMLYGDD